MAVAAFDTDVRIYRARVLSPHENLAKINFMDEGKMVLVKVDSLYQLEKEFCVLPEQVMDVKVTSGVTVDPEHEVAWLPKVLVSAPVPLELILTGFDWFGAGPWGFGFWDGA